MPGPNGPAAAADSEHLAAHEAPVLIWLGSADGSIEWVNAPAATFAGCTRDELLGRAWEARVHPDDDERRRGVCAHGLESRHPYALEYRLRRLDGGHRWMLEHAVPRFDPHGAFDGFIGSAVDIDARKHQEDRLAEHTRALRTAQGRHADFLATLSHELRNPLAPIANAASVLQTLSGREPVLLRLSEILKRQVERLAGIVSNLVDRSGAVLGTRSPVAEPPDTAALVEGATPAAHAEADGTAPPAPRFSALRPAPKAP